MLLGYNVYRDLLQNIKLNEVKVINTINPHSYCIAKKDTEFMQALKECDVLLPDGIGIVWADKVLNGQRINKIAGYDLFLFLMDYLNKNSGRCFFLGASKETLSKIESKISIEYPDIKVKSYSPPYKASFTQQDTLQMCNQVNSFEPDVLFVGMTAPKQEKWVHQNKNQIQAKTICSIGAVFDFYAGNVKRSSQLWISLGLEWLPRFLKEPKRLARRNLVSTPSFIIEVIMAKLKS